MNRLSILLRLLTGISLLMSGCRIQAPHVGPAESDTSKMVPVYQLVLGRSLDDVVVRNYLTTHHCSSATSFALCQEAGVAFLLDSNQVVEAVYLYLNQVEGFAPYQGELPFGLKYYDIMDAVVYKLSRQRIGQRGSPDSGASPDHLHYWAYYDQANMTIIYNSPSPQDEDATIYAILVRRPPEDHPGEVKWQA